MLLRQNPKHVGRVDISDLDADRLIRFQHKYYVGFVLTFGFLLPMCVPGFGWGDWQGGFYFAAIARLVGVHHATFCVNSLAHYLGDTPFDDKHTPRDHFITAFMTLGEGYHNFHHEFPQDYRNAIRFYQYDPTKWLIKFASLFGLTSNLKRFPENEVRKGMVIMKQKTLDKEKASLDWGTPINELPVLTFEEFQEKAQSRSLILIEGIVHDVSEFMDEHPGGRGYLKLAVGKDMTAGFNGGVYNHSNAAHNLMAQFRVAVVSGGGEVEHRKTNGYHPKDE